jgi:hypothetical protein
MMRNLLARLERMEARLGPAPQEHCVVLKVVDVTGEVLHEIRLESGKPIEVPPSWISE